VFLLDNPRDFPDVGSHKNDTASWSIQMTVPKWGSPSGSHIGDTQVGSPTWYPKGGPRCSPMMVPHVLSSKVFPRSVSPMRVPEMRGSKRGTPGVLPRIGTSSCPPMLGPTMVVSQGLSTKFVPPGVLHQGVPQMCVPEVWSAKVDPNVYPAR
jgi:hypothetical protein